VAGEEKVEGETLPRRNTQHKNKLWTVPEDGIDTLYAVLRRSSEKFGNAEAIGKRKLIKLHNEATKVKKIIDGKEQEVEKQWQYYEQSGYEFVSYVEFEQQCKNVGSALSSLGLKNPDRVHLFAATHPNWLAFAHGAWTLNVPIVTAYDTLGEEGLKHSLAQTNAKAMFLDPHNLPKLIKPFNETKDIQIVVYNDDESPVCKADPSKVAADVKKLQDAHPHLKIFSFSEFVKLGAEQKLKPNPPKPEDLACIMYTSGSTGVPKGVLLTHANVVGAIAGLESNVGKYVGPRDYFITFLPLAHIFELVLENTCLFWGTKMGYAHPKTISDNSAKNCRGDIAELRPTIMVGVPAVWETIKKGIIAKVNAMSPVVRNLFWGAFATKSYLAPYLASVGLETGIIDSVVFSKVREATGGRLRLVMNGGGPIAKDTQRFISMVIAPLLSGYGLTETAAMGAFTDPLGWVDDSLGSPEGSLEIKLVDFADAGYYSTNNPPQGEIWMRGASIATGGYLDLPKETEEAFTKDGWFKTGDIGEFDARGNLRIIDRKKNLVKTLNGEYIALEKLESIYRTCPVVQNICVYAALDKNKPIAIVSVVEKVIQQIGKDNGVDKIGDALLQDPKVNKAVLKEMQAAGKSAGFAPFEILEGVALTDDEWTPQSVSTEHAWIHEFHADFEHRTWSRRHRSSTERLSMTLTRMRSRRRTAAARYPFSKYEFDAAISSCKILPIRSVARPHAAYVIHRNHSALEM
jgi:long-chain acyl-CoA synthetase